MEAKSSFLKLFFFIPVKLHQNDFVKQGCFPKITLVTQRFNSNIHAQVCKSLQQLIPLVERTMGRMMLYAIRAKDSDTYIIILYK